MVILILCSLVAQTVKNLPVIQETWIRSLGQDGPLEKWMDNHSSIFAWRVPWTEEPGGLQSHGLTKSQTWLTNPLRLHIGLLLVVHWVKNLPAMQEIEGLIPESGKYPGTGHGNPLQYYCLENPMDRRDWWAIVHRVQESDTPEATGYACKAVYWLT